MPSRHAAGTPLNFYNASQALGSKPIGYKLDVARLDFDANAISTSVQCRQRRGSSSAKWIKNGIACEAEHLNKAPRNLDRIGRWMIRPNLSCYVRPNR